MNILEKVFIAAGIIVVGVTVAYRYVLSDEQRDSMREAADVLRNVSHEVSDSVSPFMSGGPTHAEEQAAAESNRARTASQWSELGY
jgi:predicted negative regulator of RcsB-dependent stress response